MSEQNQSKLKLREFGLTTLSIQNKTTVFVLIAIITLSGISSYLSVPKEAFPRSWCRRFSSARPTPETARRTWKSW